MTPSEAVSSAVAATWSPIRPTLSVSDALELSLEDDSLLEEARLEIRAFFFSPRTTAASFISSARDLAAKIANSRREGPKALAGGM